jgi:ubiquinol-cytochrome c reductase cytochrome c1 subunit
MRKHFSLLALGFSLLATTAYAGTEARHPKEVELSFSNPIFGKFERPQLQRGYQVYKQVCAACHSVDQLSYRNLSEIGFTEQEVKAIAKADQVDDVSTETGEIIQRPGVPTDKMIKPYANVEAAKAANNGAAPPDLSLIMKARHEGPQYVYSLLMGYDEKPPAMVKNTDGEMEKFEISEGLHYNPYFPGWKIGMAKQIEADKVTYADGTKATADQMSKDVVAFLMWAAEPGLEKRRQTGIAVVGFLAIFSVLSFLSYKRIWKDIH